MDTYDGTEGNEALAAGLPVMDGSEDWRDGWKSINKTRDKIVTFIRDTLAVLWPLPVNKGGTGATTLAAARAALGVWGNSGAVTPGQTPTLGWNGARLLYEVPGYATPRELANLSDVGGGAYLPLAGGTMSGHLYSPPARSTPVTSSYVAAYLNGDGRLGATPSAAKYKHDIADYQGSALGLRPVTYVLNDDPLETVRLGIVADEANDVEPMLVVHEDGEVESFKYELLAVALLADVQRLTRRVEELEARHADR